MLRLANTADRVFPATTLYNEGWLLRLVLDWFAHQRPEGHPLSLQPGARWFSEALLPSQFFARRRGDRLAEGWTHADGVIGHFVIGGAALADTTLAANAIQFVVTEAKLFSPLSPGVTNARYFDQAARSVACIVDVLCRGPRKPDDLCSLAFFVIAPAAQIKLKLFDTLMHKNSIEAKVRKRISEYPSPDYEAKRDWLEKWFLPTLQIVKVECLCWENVIDFIHTKDAHFGSELPGFYADCLKFNRVQEPIIEPAVASTIAPSDDPSSTEATSSAQ